MHWNANENLDADLEEGKSQADYAGYSWYSLLISRSWDQL